WISLLRYASKLRSSSHRPARGSQSGLLPALPLFQSALRLEEVFFPQRLAPKLRPLPLQPSIDPARRPDLGAAPTRRLKRAVDRVEMRAWRRAARRPRTANRRAVELRAPG